jgi:hypothetical protein
MQGGYNVAPLISALSDPDEAIASSAADQLKKTLLVFDAFYDIEQLGKDGNKHAAAVMESWANAEWFLERPDVPDKVREDEERRTDWAKVVWNGATTALRSEATTGSAYRLSSRFSESLIAHQKHSARRYAPRPPTLLTNFHLSLCSFWPP